MSNVIVITRHPVDLGVGADQRVVFVDAKFHVDSDERLHIQHDARVTDQGGNIASFARGEWLMVVRNVGTIGKLVDTADVQVGSEVTVVPAEVKA